MNLQSCCFQSTYTHLPRTDQTHLFLVLEGDYSTIEYSNVTTTIFFRVHPNSGALITKTCLTLKVTNEV